MKLRLFKVKNEFFTSKKKAKIYRNTLNGMSQEKYTVEKGPDHKDYKGKK